MFLFTISNRRVRVVCFICTLVLSVLLLSNCEEESAKQRSYPRLTGMKVSDISEEGATFYAEISSLGSEPILEHGFVWGSSSYLSIGNSNRVFLGPYSNTGIYSTEIYTALIKDEEYVVKPFLKTPDHVIYGTPFKFISLGSSAPIITGFEPHSAGWLDTIYIRGKNFSWLGGENTVRIDKYVCSVLASTDTTLIAIVDFGIDKIKSILTVELAGNTAVFTSDTFRLIPPVLKDFNPKTARWGDTLLLTGKDLRYVSSHYGNYIKLGTLSCRFIDNLSDTSISVIVPYEISVIESDLNLNLNGFILHGKQPFKLAPPPPFLIDPREGTWGNILTLTGNFNNLISRNTVFFDDVQATIISNSSRELKVQVPAALSKVRTNIIYKANPFTITSADTFHLKGPVIKTFSPTTGTGGTDVTVKGKYFNNGTTTVKFGTTTAVISSMNDSIIKVKVPSGVNGQLKISVTVRLQTVFSTTDFTAINPTIDNIFPLTGSFNDWITITGNNFISSIGGTGVYFGNTLTAIKDLSNNSVTAKVPLSIDSIPKSITVTVGPNSFVSQDKFILSPPEILSVSPDNLQPGQDVTITGLNLNPVPSNNKVYLDIYPMSVKSATSTSIVATLPNSLPRGNFKIKIIVGGYIRYSSQEIIINSQWLRIPSPILRTSEYYGSFNPIAGKGLKEFGYLCSTNDNGLTYRFDPRTNSWLKLNLLAPVDKSKNFSNLNEIVCQDTFYMIYGRPAIVIGIDEINESWNRKPVFPEYTENAVAFSLSNKIYFGLNNMYSGNTNFYEIDPSKNYRMSQLSNTMAINAGVAAYFTLKNKGFVLFTNNSVWKFESESLSWTRLADFPGKARTGAISFIIGDDGYIGTGNSNSDYKVLNDIWIYNISTDSWTNVTSMPNPRQIAVAFTINGKAYIGYGMDGSTNLFDFYEFDPGYTVK